MELKVAETGPQKGGSQVRIIARIEKMAGGFYAFDGKTFDSFLTARRAMLEQTRRRRSARRQDDMVVAQSGKRAAVSRMSGASGLLEPEFERV
jgi:hypothetical protein